MVRLKLIFGFALLSILCARYSDAALAAMSIDLGSQFMKLALVKPGVPMEIVHNRESRRKTDTQIGINGEMRHFGDASKHMRLRYPKQVYGYLIDLLGKKFDHPAVHLYQKRFPYYKLVPDQNRGSVLFENAEGVHYSVEELVGMIIADARKVVSKYAEQEVKDATITVPAFFNQAERRAMLEAAEIGGVNLLQLMNDNTAAGLNYGMFRRKQFNETSTKIMIYDMGATYTSASLFEYSIALDKISREKNPQMTVLGVCFDRTLGGLEMTLRLRDHLAKLFQQQHAKKLKSDVKHDARAINKLLEEAERVKKVLSANQDHIAQVENLFEELDLKVPISRKEFCDLIDDLLPRIVEPVNRALEMAELKIEDLDYIILMGGGTRLPKVQETLQSAIGNKELSKFLNTDEAIAMGAVYQAAHRSKGFKVKKFIIKDLNLYPIVVDFERDLTSVDRPSPESDDHPKKTTSEDEGKESTSTDDRRLVRRTLFNLRNQYPQRRKMTFSKHAHDFEFVVNYGDLSHLSPDNVDFFGEVNVSRVYLSGVTDLIKKHLAVEGTIYKGARAHFRMDESGILQLESADVSFDKTGPAVEVDDSATSTFQKLGQKISSFFSGSSPESADKKEQAENKTETPEADGEKQQSSGDGDKKQETEPEKKDTSTEKNETASAEGQNATAADANATLVAEKPKIVQRDFPLKVEKSFMDFSHLTKEQLKERLDRIKLFEDKEREKLELAKARNDLESYVIDMKYRLMDDPVYAKCADDKEKDDITTKCQQYTDWLDEQGPDVAKKEYDTRLKALKDASKHLNYKVEQAKERPKVTDALNKVLNYTVLFLTTMKNFSVGDQQVFTQSDLDIVEKMIVDTQKWLEDKEQEQAKLPESATPVLTVEAMLEKSQAMERHVQHLITKAKFTKPKSKQEDKTTTGGKESSSNETDESTAQATTNKTADADEKKSEDTGKKEEQEIPEVLEVEQSPAGDDKKHEEEQEAEERLEKQEAPHQEL